MKKPKISQISLNLANTKSPFALKPLAALVIGACCAFGAQSQNAAATGNTVGIWTPAAGLPVNLSADGTTEYGSAQYDTGNTAIFGPPGTPRTLIYGNEAFF